MWSSKSIWCFILLVRGKRVFLLSVTDIEVANRHGHTCLMIACYKGHYKIAQYLLSLKANVNRRSIKGNTALHDCAESGSLEILQLLLEHGATMDVDSYGMTPLLAASVTGHFPIVEHLISLSNVRREDRISALELLGATYVDKKRDMLTALSFWRRAMEYRYCQQPMIPKPTNRVPVPAYDYAQEVNDINALDELVMDPDEMRMQALVVRERILGPSHPDTSYYIRYRSGASLTSSSLFSVLNNFMAFFFVCCIFLGERSMLMLVVSIVVLNCGRTRSPCNRVYSNPSTK